ncbi:predicted protein [Histoplasma capsulatum H143]|uniref:Uncharacterized protein n=1 Tax=Ajellomyces capsulatus (strain H143) TaxID=544712 RepID=C6HCK5_AJECH|nr:predicted protein [Histoplasma capsulatum H143]
MQAHVQSPAQVLEQSEAMRRQHRPHRRRQTGPPTATSRLIDGARRKAKPGTDDAGAHQTRTGDAIPEREGTRPRRGKRGAAGAKRPGRRKSTLYPRFQYQGLKRS